MRTLQSILLGIIDAFFYCLLIAVMLLAVVKVSFSAETWEKKDDNTLTIRSTIEITTEKTYEEAQAELDAAILERAQAIEAHTKRLAGIDETIATLTKRLAEADKLGIKAKPAEVADGEQPK